MLGRRGCGVATIVSVGFVVTLMFMLPVALWLADPLTLRPVKSDDIFQSFPVLVVSGDTARVNVLESYRDIPPPPSDATYLVPLERVQSLERYIREHDNPDIDASWVLKVRELSPNRQRIELFRMGDGYWGGVYEATATTVTPQYKKLADPGFAFIFGPLALVLNTVLWGAVLLMAWMRRVRRLKRLKTS